MSATGELTGLATGTVVPGLVSTGCVHAPSKATDATTKDANINDLLIDFNLPIGVRNRGSFETGRRRYQFPQFRPES